MADVKDPVVPLGPPPSYEVVANPPAPGKPVQARPLQPLNLPTLNFLRDKRVILASASPRRKQLLAQIGLNNVEIRPSSFAEDLPKTLSPFEYVVQTATQKAMAVYKISIDDSTRGDPSLVLAADTVVVSHSGQVLEKPRSEAEHIAMLKMLRTTGAHKVYTGVVGMAPLASARDPGYAIESHVEETTVKFGKDIGDEVLMAYVRTREGVDKAGGYGIQGMGTILVERIEGSYDNVVGLPLRATLGLIEKVMAKAEEEEQEPEAEGDEDVETSAN